VDPQLRSQYKAALKDSGNPGPKSQQKASTSRRTGGHTSNLLPETYDDTEVIGLTANGSGSRVRSFGQAQENSMEPVGLDEVCSLHPVGFQLSHVVLVGANSFGFFGTHHST
jgi:hypothetical protein